MKKKNVWIAAFVIAQTVNAAAYASGTEISIDGNTVSGEIKIESGIHTLSTQASGETVCLAVYENGRLKAVTLEKELSYNFPTEGASVKCFVWDKEMKPVCEAAQVVQIKPQTETGEYVYEGQAQCVPDEDWDFDEYTIKLKVRKINAKIAEIYDIAGYEANGEQTNAVNRSYIKSAQKLTDKIISKQSLEVDAISGATCASNAIVEAVKNALNSEAINKPEPTPTQEPISIADGIYYGTSQCMGKNINYPIDVNVEVVNGKISNIEDKTLREPMSKKDRELYDIAWSKISEEIKGKENSYNIDMVSGATVSSAGISSAIENALTAQNTPKPSDVEVYAPESISVYARTYPIVTVREGKISEIRIVPISTTDTDKLKMFVQEIIKNQALPSEYPEGAEEDAYNISALIGQILYGKGVLADE